MGLTSGILKIQEERTQKGPKIETLMQDIALLANVSASCCKWGRR